LNDATNRVSNGSLVDLVGGLGWKGTGVLILVNDQVKKNN